jgi:hypothetical protein
MMVPLTHQDTSARPIPMYVAEHEAGEFGTRLKVQASRDSHWPAAGAPGDYRSCLCSELFTEQV